MITTYELNYYSELTDQQRKAVAKKLSYSEAMNHGLLGEIRREFPGIYETMAKREFETDPAKRKLIVYNEADEEVSRNYPPELFMEWDELMKEGLLGNLRKNNPTCFWVIYLDTFEGEYDKVGVDKKEVDVILSNDYKAARKQWWIEKMSKLSWDQLMKANLTKKLRDYDSDLYKEKFKEQYGHYPPMA